MSETVTANLKLDTPSKGTPFGGNSNIIWTIGIIAVSFTGLALWIEYRKFRQIEFLVDIKNAGARIHSRPAPYPWMLPFLTTQTRPLIEFVSPLEYDADLVGGMANKDAIKKTLMLPNLVTLNLVNIRPVDNEILAAIGHLPSLRALNLVGSAISDDGIGLLASSPSLERLFVERVALSEKSLDTLLEMYHLKELILGENGLDLVQSFTFETKDVNESKTIKVGDILTFTGTFRSVKIIPTSVNLSCFQFSNGRNSSLNLAGTVTQLEDGTSRFVLKAPTKIESPGFYMIRLSFSSIGSRIITFTQAVKGFNVLDPAQPQPKVPQSVVPMKIEGKVDLKEGTNPK